jgi:hypothetical protein
MIPSYTDVQTGEESGQFMAIGRVASHSSHLFIILLLFYYYFNMI